MKHAAVQRAGESGAVFVEVALLFPFFILFIFATIAFCIGSNAAMSLEHSVTTVRQAITRGDVSRVGDQILEAVSQYRVGNDTKLRNLLVHNVSPTSWNYYDQMANDVFGSGCGVPIGFNDLSDAQLYAFVYAAQTMLQNVGSADTRFPCDPEGTGIDDGPGCIQCRGLHPTSRESTYDIGLHGAPSFCDQDFNRNWIGIECEYKLGSGMLSPVIRLVDLVTPGVTSNVFTFRARHAFEVAS